MGTLESRKNFVLGQINTAVPPIGFNVTTPDGTSSAGPLVTIQGDGWVNVREIRAQGASEPLAATWTDNNSFQVSVPILPGSNSITLTAYGFQGLSLGTDTVQVTGTGTAVPADASNLVVSEIMYHPEAPSDDDIAAGFADADEFEFIEVTNIHPTHTIDLTNVRFVSGIPSAFANGTQLGPGQRYLFVRTPAAFSRRYPSVAAARIAGSFGPDAGLSNGGEEISLVDAAGRSIKTFTYGDSAPWPEIADGFGRSLVLIAPQTNPDHSLPQNWRPSVNSRGNPDADDVIPFVGDPLGDLDHNGIADIIDYAVASPVGFTSAGMISFERVLGTNAVIIPEVSETLESWTAAVLDHSEPPNGISDALHFRPPQSPVPAWLFARLRVIAP